MAETNAGKARTVSHWFSDGTLGGEIPKLRDAILGGGGKKISFRAADYFNDRTGMDQRLTHGLSRTR